MDENKSQKITALYVCANNGDLQNESRSIKIQKRLLENYAFEKGFGNIRHFMDERASEKTSSRTGFNEMIEEVAAGNIGVIIVKDMNCLGFNAIEANFYTKLIFPEKEIRFIAIKERIDSMTGNDEFTEIRNIIRHIFSKSNSQAKSEQVRSMLKSKGAEGNRLTTIPIYGYMPDPDNKDKWVVDPEAAAVVKLVYEMYIEGKGPFPIAKELQNKKILSPTAYMAKTGIGKFRNSTVKDPYKWNAQTVTNILEMPEYVGHTVNFKTYKPSYETNAKKKTSCENWLIFKNTQEAVIDEETWELAQKLRKTSRGRSQHESKPSTSIFQDDTTDL